MANQMKRWRMDELGRKHLRLVEDDIPNPGPTDILVRVGAVSLNFRDIMCLDRGLDFPGPNFTPCSDMAGTVVAVGRDVKRFKVDDRVISVQLPDWIDGEVFAPTVRAPHLAHLGGEHPGVLAQYVAIDQAWAVRAPETIDDVAASTLPCAGLTAWFALVERGGLKAGQSVLVHGTGGVAILGLQIAIASGARTYVVSRDNSKLKRAQMLGAHVAINRNDGDWVEAVRKESGGRGVDHILETIGGPHLGKSLEAAAEAGRVSMIGLFEGIEFSGKFPHLIRKHLKIEGIGVGHRRGLEDLVRAVDANSIKPVVDHVYKIDEVQEALAHLDRGAFGKVVIKM
jgi:NADPH:quinone reductase-like Zn-dependent oxidoreductase